MDTINISHECTNSNQYASEGTILVHTRSLPHGLEVDPRTRTAKVWHNVPMNRLVEAILKYGSVPPVMMEIPVITVGGGYTAISGKSG